MVEKRVYQIWKGNNIFLLSGRLIFGPDIKSLVLSVVLIVAPAVIFFVFIARHLLHRFSHRSSGIAVLVIAVLFTIYVLSLLLLTSTRDPGIIPRNPHPPEPEEYSESVTASPAEWGSQTPRLRLPRTKDVELNGITVKIKYCDTCMLYRPPRCSHCSICNNCVERFDHHCPWVGQCIGRRNYRFFFMFVSSAALLCIYVFGFSALYFKFVMEGDTDSTVGRSVWQSMRESPAAVALMIYTFIAIWFVGGLTVFHLHLIGTNQTTYENFRFRSENRVNPFDRGVIKNFQEIFCTPIPPSKIDFRAKVQVEASGQIVVNPQSVVKTNKQGREFEVDSNHGSQAAAATIEAHEESRSRISDGHDLALEMKDSYRDSFAQAIGHQFPLGGSDTRSHPRRSSWGRKSGSWEIAPEVLTLNSGKTESGRVNADDSIGGRGRENERKHES